MPEYLTPGVYVEETSFRSKSIEGVPTSTFGMAGPARTGPVSYVLGSGRDATRVLVRPTLVTSFTEFERAFGDLGRVGGEDNHLAHAARAFFANGGRRLYVSRVFPWFKKGTEPDPDRQEECFASLDVGKPVRARWRARWPGAFGREISVKVEFRRGRNIARKGVLSGVRPGCLVELTGGPVDDRTAPQESGVRVVVARPDGSLAVAPRSGAAPEEIGPDQEVCRIRLAVTVQAGSRRDVYNELELDPSHPRSIFTVLRAADPADEFSLVCLLPVPPSDGRPPPTAGQLLTALLGDTDAKPSFLTGGSDGDVLTAADLKGREANLRQAAEPATGLAALGEVDDISIVAMPSAAALTGDELNAAVDGLIGHCEALRYRMAVVDPPKDSSISEVREFRAGFDSKYAALYHPWLKIIDPAAPFEPGAPTPLLEIPPSGAVAGIYARSDIERGVHKAPANEVVRGLTRFTHNITYDQQSVLNPEGINVLRYFEGRGNRVWGARTMSSDPEWKYVNVRRLFIYLEHSIDKATQWAVFEPNNERLWASVRQSIEDFLLATWRTGALMGTRPEEAYFVRCDRTTMSQNDLDNGRLVCLVGVAPTSPAEFVIFRIGQWTADAQPS